MSNLGDRGHLQREQRGETGKDPMGQRSGSEHQRSSQHLGSGGSGMGGVHMPEPRTEGRVASRIEEQTSRIPSDAFLWAAGAAILGSVVLQSLGKKHDSLFVGQWPPVFLLLGLYNKLVKVAGHDSRH